MRMVAPTKFIDSWKIAIYCLAMFLSFHRFYFFFYYQEISISCLKIILHMKEFLFTFKFYFIFVPLLCSKKCNEFFFYNKKLKFHKSLLTTTFFFVCCDNELIDGFIYSSIHSFIYLHVCI